jgi:hypothetical protein
MTSFGTFVVSVLFNHEDFYGLNKCSLKYFMLFDNLIDKVSPC